MALNNIKKFSKLIDVIEYYQSEGRYTFSFTQALTDLKVSKAALRLSIARLKRKKRLISPRKEFFVIVPLEYHSVGSPPVPWFINDLMQFINQPYYVACLSAAALYGASHQYPQVFQVVTNKSLLPMKVGSAQIQFLKKLNLNHIAVTKMKTDTGFITVSTEEATIFDLIRYKSVSGNFSNIANILYELGDQINPERLITASKEAKVPEIQRIGYLLEVAQQPQLADIIFEILKNRKTRAIPLNPSLLVEGSVYNQKWKLYINDQVEADL